MYAIIEESGKQFKVTGGDTILIDREAPPEGTDRRITFDRVLLVGGAGGDTRVGAPLVAGATVTGEVLGQAKGPKIDIFKYKRRKGYRRRKGHRQHYLKVRITDINV